jgi:DNA-binding response OmpR family regulator
MLPPPCAIAVPEWGTKMAQSVRTARPAAARRGGAPARDALPGAARVLLVWGRVRILVVDPEPRQLETICRGLFVFGHEAIPAATPEDAARLLAGRGDRHFDLLVIDVRTPDHRGIALFEVVHGMAPSLPTLITTGLAKPADVALLRTVGTAVLVKPFTPDELDAAVRTVAARQDAAAR